MQAFTAICVYGVHDLAGNEMCAYAESFRDVVGGDLGSRD
jgi:hypothetical protein